MDKFSELKAAAMAATPGPWGINRAGNTIVSNQSHPVATLSNAFHRQLADGGVGKDAEFIAAANPDVVLALLAELEKAQKHEKEWKLLCEAAAVDLDDWRAVDDKSRGLICKLADVIIERNGRIAELEAEITNIVDSHAETVAELRAKLATPVDINLPERRDDSYDWDGASPSEAFNTCRSICGLMFRQQLRAAGFKVEGGE
ncbi:ead/Ea22-like family protein [Serratia marcescens]|uniref:ead/Ea22-like family protein n=1 Tax=Serratia marcescens TaxID=615 RepID=UPI0007C98365|nr:ead/Ea22-like family protein [Serratia marcescens]OAH27083.1 hypothetical protein AYJ10_09195 [Serratia marcescens]